MATPPRGRSNTKRPGAQNNRSKVIDLDAKDIKDTSPDVAKQADQKTSSVNAETEKVHATTKPAAASSSQKPANKPAASRSSVPKSGTVKKPDTATTATKPSGSKPQPSQKPTAKITSASDDNASSTEKNGTIKNGKTRPNSSPSSVPSPSNNNTSFTKMAAAGIVGGIITLGGAGFMQYSDLLPNLGTVSDAQPLPTIDLTPLQSKLGQLQDQVDGLSGGTTTQATAQKIDLTPIENRLTSLENKPAPLASTSPTSLEGGEVQQIEDKIAKLTSEIAALKGAAETTAVKMSEIEEASPKQDAGTLIGLAIAPLKSNAERANAKLGELEQKMSALSTKIDEDVDARISAFDEKLKNAATGEKLAKSVALNALKTSVAKGEPFSGALTSLETLTGPSKPIEWLKAVASSGIPTDQELQSEFGNLQSGILLAANNDPDATITDRLMSSISSLVTVSSSEAVSGGSAQAIISRVSANMKSGNFGAAISEWKSLPDEAQQASKAWMEKLSLRMDADRQMYKLLKSVQADS